MTNWVGLTGGIGSGKSSAASFFVKLGVRVIDADEISRSLTEYQGAALPKIAEAFGDGALLDGRLNRDFMRQLIFSEPPAKERLEKILHPLIIQEISNQKMGVKAAYAIVDVPLLTELPIFQTLVDRILVIDCPPDLQIKRVMTRSGLSETQIKAIMTQQASREQRLAISDDIIINDRDLMHLQQAVLLQHQQYQKLFGTT